MKIEMNNIGELFQSEDDKFYWESCEVIIPAIFNTKWSFIFEDFDPSTQSEKYQDAINNFMKMSNTDFKKAGPYLFQYYEDTIQKWNPKPKEYEKFYSANDVWSHVDFSSGYYITASTDVDDEVYLSLSSNCDWNEEHGLQIVYYRGNELVRVGSFTGHFRNPNKNLIFQY